MLHTELESGNDVAYESRPLTHTESREKRERSDTGEIHEEEEKREGEERDLSVERQRGRVIAHAGAEEHMPLYCRTMQT